MFYQCRFLRTSFFLAAGLSLLVSTAGCKKKTPEPTPVVVAAPEITVQIASMDPSRSEPNKSFPAKIYGSGFVDGAKVWVGDMAMSQARVENPNTIKLSVSGLAAGNYDIIVENPDGDRATLRSGLRVKGTTSACDLVTINFAFDASKINKTAQNKLEKAVPCYQGKSGKITVEGHTDNRGTTEYNLALGNRRADAVSRYLSNHGVSKSRLKTVSYGEERPATRGNNESAWADNRRADLKAKE